MRRKKCGIVHRFVFFWMALKEKNIIMIILFKLHRNCKRHNKENFMLKSNSNKLMLCRGGGQHYLVFNKILT